MYLAMLSLQRVVLSLEMGVFVLLSRGARM